MTPKSLKIELVRDGIRSALRAGRHLPGERIETELLANEFKVSVTSVRFALHRLVGEGSIEDHLHGGFRVPAPSERALRSLYKGLQWLLTHACRMPLAERNAEPPDTPQSGDDTVTLTHRFLDSLAEASGDPWLRDAIGRANDQLGPIRRMELVLLPDGGLELARLHQHWRKRDLRTLSKMLAAYHQERERLVERIVAMYRTPAQER